MPKVAEKQTKAQLIAERDELLARLGKLQGSASTSPLKVVDVAGMSIEETIEMALSTKRTLTWQAANVVVNGQVGFFPSRIPTIVNGFEAKLQGSSALIVSSSGKQAAKVADQHAAWLGAHGFEKLPGVKKATANNRQDMLLKLAEMLLKS